MADFTGFKEDRASWKDLEKSKKDNDRFMQLRKLMQTAKPYLKEALLQHSETKPEKLTEEDDEDLKKNLQLER